MKTLFSLLFMYSLLFSLTVNAQNEFITIWNPGNPNTTTTSTTTTQISIPITGSAYTISWSEVGYPAHSGTLTNQTSTYNAPVIVDFGTPSNPTANAATYEVKIFGGSVTQIKFAYAYGDRYKITEIKQWGNTPWVSMNAAFQDCRNLEITATDAPNLSGVTDMQYMFHGCYALTGNASMNNWITSSVINMSSLFQAAYLFNAPIGKWDMRQVQDISGMFSGAESFNQPLNDWKTGNITNMSTAFSDAKAFNQPIGAWNTANVTDMSGMFLNFGRVNPAFNQPIGSWNTSKVTTMYKMFSKASAFNQNIDSWDVSKVTNFEFFLMSCKNYNQPMNSWVLNTQEPVNMSNMFSAAESFNQPLSNWNTVKVTDMSSMFSNATAFNQPIGNWNTAAVTDMSGMFTNATAFNQALPNWSTGAVKSMNTMFYGAEAFNQDIGSWNLSNVTAMSYIFMNSGMSCQAYNNTLVGWANNPNTPNNINLQNLSPLKYSSTAAVTARNTLIGKNWTFTGDVYDASCTTVLPVTFGSITAEIKNGLLFVNWATLDEKNCDHYKVQISKEGEKFFTIGEVKTLAPNGESNVLLQYSFQKNTASMAGLLALPAFLLLLISARSKRQRIFSLLVMIAMMSMLFNSCKKTELLTSSNSQKMYVRILQVDKDGKQQISKVIQVVQD